MSGFGASSGWYRNLMSGGGVEVQIAGDAWSPQARRLAPSEAATMLERYERRHRLLAPVVRRLLSRLSGVPYDGRPESRTAVVAALPLLALTPRHGEPPAPAGG